MGKYKYFAQHMHMHSCYQPGASMEGHIYNAANLGMKYIWFTDHDIRMGRKQFQIDSFDFQQDVLFSTDENGRSQGFKTIGENQQNCKVELDKGRSLKGSQCLKISSYSDGIEWKGGGVYFCSSGNRHCSSLLAGVSLEIGTMLDESQDCRVIFDVRLSQRPPENKCAHLIYVIGDTQGLEGQPHTAIIPLKPARGWVKYTLNLSKDVLQQTALEQGVGGIDNAFDTLTIIVESRNGAGVAYFNDFMIYVKEEFEAVRSVQKRIAKEKGKQYGVIPFVGTEISAAGPHKNCFSTTVPIIPYDKFDYKVSHDEAIEWVKKFGGIFSLNHPFEQYKRDVLDDREKEERLVWMAKDFIQHKAWGASLIEVGYPLGRGNFSLQFYLRLWDKLTEAGIIMTGYGSSDNHSNQSGWYNGNNFATWLGVAVDEVEPINEDTFVEAMVRGNVYTGNPVVLKGNICFETDEGVPMGSVLVADNNNQHQIIRFYCNQTEKNWKFRLISNGKVTVETIIDSEEFEFKCDMVSDKLINFVRAELYDENGTCIMLTNPIHIWRKDLGDCSVPAIRMVQILEGRNSR